MVKLFHSRRSRAIAYFTALVAALLLLNYVSQFYFFRIDLTSDRRYTLLDASKQVMRELDDNVLVQVFLDGDMPAEMKKLRATIKETLDELKVYSRTHLQYEFVNIAEMVAPSELNIAYTELREYGLSPVAIQEHAADGSRSERILFPGAIISHARTTPEGVEMRDAAVNFLQDNATTEANSGESLLIAEQNVETALVSAIARIVKRELPRIAFVDGHGELDEYECGDISKELASAAHLDRVTINGQMNALDDYAVVIIAKPMQQWPDEDKIVVDQYLMNGGRVAWFVDAVDVHHDSLARGENTFALACRHELDDQLFKYGVRINPNVVSDLMCAFLPVNIAPPGQTADFKLAPWTYYPLLIPPTTHAITRGLNLIESKYPSTIDTVGNRKLGEAKQGSVHKYILLHSSENSRTQTVPALITLSQSKQRPDPEAYQQAHLPVAVLLEGQFRSAYTNRPLDNYNRRQPFTFKEHSDTTKMIIVADGDIIRNDVVRRADGTRIYPLGFNRYMQQQFGNRDFVKNCIYYLLDDDDTMQIRRREWTLRLLDRTKIFPQRTRRIALNTAVPIIVTLLAGAVFIGLRKRKYAAKRL